MGKRDFEKVGTLLTGKRDWDAKEICGKCVFGMWFHMKVKHDQQKGRRKVPRKRRNVVVINDYGEMVLQNEKRSTIDVDKRGKKTVDGHKKDKKHFDGTIYCVETVCG